jgi:hypothetical protein
MGTEPEAEVTEAFKAELSEPPCYVCHSYFCTNYDYCDVPQP